MNERIKKHALEAFGSTIDNDPILVYEAEKFAELIVRECAGIVKWTPTGVSHARIIEIIKQHFGVQ
jgi:hypothetical protein